MSLFTLKVIALVTMTIDHVGKFFFPEEPVWSMVGRLAFPIFAWGIANGYAYTKDVKKYMLRLGAFALISQVPFTLAYKVLGYNPFVLSIFTTLLIALVAIHLIQQSRTVWLQVLVATGAALLAYLLNTDYGAYGVLLTIVFHLTYMQPLRMLLWQTVLWLSMVVSTTVASVMPSTSALVPSYVPILMIFQGLTLLSVVLISMYNGVQGPKLRWVFYWFYPIHLMLLILAKLTL